MNHPAPLAPAQPWRAAALVAAAIALVELFILIVVGFTFGGKLFSERVKTVKEAATEAAAPAKATAERGHKEPSPAPTLARSETSVIVLNGNGVAGAAALVAERVRRRGYVIAGTANAPRSDVVRSFVMYRPQFAGEARRLAHDLRVRRIRPLRGMRIGALQGAHVALVIGE